MDRPPPPKSAEEYLKEEFKSARTGVAVLLVVSYTLGRSVQLFSRKPGTSGGVPIVGSMIAIVAFSCYYVVTVQELGREDAIGLEYLILASLIWLVIDFAKATFRRRSAVGDYCLGRGILWRWLPNMSFRSVGFSSDLVVASTAGLFFHWMDSPIQANWFAAMIAWLSITHAWYLIRVISIRQRMKRAIARSSFWSPKRKQW